MMARMTPKARFQVALEGWLPNIIATPHVAFSEESVRELALQGARNVAAILAGRRPASVVNPAVLTLPRWAHLTTPLVLSALPRPDAQRWAQPARPGEPPGSRDAVADCDSRFRRECRRAPLRGAAHRRVRRRLRAVCSEQTRAR
jgi:hypothetical protein